MNEASPAARARLAGALYGISAIPAAFSVFVLGELIVRGDPTATAANVLGSEALFRLGFAADLAGIVLVLGSVLVLSELFRPVDRTLALSMVVFCAVGSTLQAFNSLQDLTALLLLKDAGGPIGLPAEHARALAFVFVRLHALTYDLALVFFGVFAILAGALVLRSTFLPRVLGVLMVIDGLGYLTFSFSTFLALPFVRLVYPFLPMGTAILGEATLMLWLLVRGVDARRWRQRAAMS